MAKPRTTPPPRGRPPKAVKAVVPPVTGVRIPEDLRAELDALVETLNVTLAAQGASTNRSAVMVLLLREALEARRRARAPGGEP